MTDDRRSEDRPGTGRREEWKLVVSVCGTVVAAYLGLRYLVPWLSVWSGATAGPAPVPAFAVAAYMGCVALGAFVYLSSDARRGRAFLSPFVRLLAGRTRRHVVARRFLVVLLPLAVGWATWEAVRPEFQRPPTFRRQHPTMPPEYAELENPYRHASPPAREAAVEEGTVLYQKNCRPCHGAAADGRGPLARGLRLQPVNFQDAGTIATVVEPYPFWRIETGAMGLPSVATPWNSAMPAWEDELDPDQIWKIILAEYLLAETEPRQPEGE